MWKKSIRTVSNVTLKQTNKQTNKQATTKKHGKAVSLKVRKLDVAWLLCDRLYTWFSAGYKPVKRPISSSVTWRIQSMGCFKDRRRRAAVGRMIVNLQGVKNAVMRCFRQARKLGYKLFAIQEGGKCFAGPRGHLTYGKYGRSRRCRNGMGGKWAINVYTFSKCK